VANGREGLSTTQLQNKGHPQIPNFAKPTKDQPLELRG
jgi:hypothetical protein